MAPHLVCVSHDSDKAQNQRRKRRYVEKTQTWLVSIPDWARSCAAWVWSVVDVGRYKLQPSLTRCHHFQFRIGKFAPAVALILGTLAVFGDTERANNASR